MLLVIICIVFGCYRVLTTHHLRIPVNHWKLINIKSQARHDLLSIIELPSDITPAPSEITLMDQPQQPSTSPNLMNRTHIWGLPMEPVNIVYPGNIYFSVKTTHYYYSERLLDLLLTWCQAVDKDKVNLCLLCINDIHLFRCLLYAYINRFHWTISEPPYFSSVLPVWVLYTRSSSYTRGCHVGSRCR